MKKYINPKDDRYHFVVVETLNGYSIEVLIVSTGDIAALTPAFAARLQVALPKPYRLQSCARENAEAELDRVAEVNGWVVLETQ